MQCRSPKYTQANTRIPNLSLFCVILVMGGCRCSYRHCKSSTKLGGDLHFFHFPVKNKDRCRDWIINAKRPEFQNLPIDQLRNKVICGLHFETTCFTNIHRKRLVHDAVPTLSGGSTEDEGQMDIKDIQVLPTNADATIFTVDTDSMQPSIDDTTMCTYSIKNGNLIPVFSETDVDDEHAEILYINQGVEANHNEYLFIEPKFQRSEDSNYHSSVTPTENSAFNESPQYAAGESSTKPIYKVEFIDVLDNTCVDNQKVDDTVKVAPKKKFKKRKRNKQFDNYVLQLLMRHTREIAALKRAMKKQLFLKPIHIMRALQGRVPASMLAAIRLQLFKQKKQLLADETQLLTKLYATSKDSYHLFRDQLNWHFPEPTCIESLMKKD